MKKEDFEKLPVLKQAESLMQNERDFSNDFRRDEWIVANVDGVESVIEATVYVDRPGQIDMGKTPIEKWIDDKIDSYNETDEPFFDDADEENDESGGVVS